VYSEIMLELERQILFDTGREEGFFNAIPARPAVILIEPRANLPSARPLLLRTADLRRRMRLLLREPEANSKRLNLREYASRIRFRITGSHFEQALVHWQHARALWPANYRGKLRLYPSPLIKLNLANAYPRAYVTRRLGGSGVYVGPFLTRRAAQSFLDETLSLFRIRRCQIKIRRDPEFPGCIYSEMKMCLAPCFAGCTAADYADEAARAAAFFRSRGASLAEALTVDREAASADLNFEHASALHKRLEKVQELRRSLPELVRPVNELNAVIVVRAADDNAIALFRVAAGEITDPFILQFGPFNSQSQSPEQILREFLEPGNRREQLDRSQPRSDLSFREREDQLALLARWAYGSARDGEIFFYEARPAGWPYRRILHACRRLLAPPGNEKPPVNKAAPNLPDPQ
jgi:excinuclease ABC subunit C